MIDIPPSGDSAEVHAPFETTIGRELSHHVRDVLRKKTGEELIAVDRESGRAFTAIVCSLKPDVSIRIIKPLETAARRSRVALLACALLKGDRDELICEKACELGVGEIIMWPADHSIVKLTQKSGDSRIKRYRAIIDSAARQSFNTHPPSFRILPSSDVLAEELRTRGNRLKICYGSLAASAIALRDLDLAERDAAVIIGPEGDFSAREDDLFSANGWSAVSFGPLILRAETAAIAAVAGINAVFGVREADES